MKQYKHVIKKVKDLIPYARNSRTHSDAQVKQIASSILEFGFTNPVLIDEKDLIIAGHGRILAAEMIELDEVPCIVLEGLTEAQKKAYVIADNKLALNAGWDFELLSVEIQDLAEIDFDLDILGFNDQELNEILDQTEEKEPSSPTPVTDDQQFLIVVNCKNENGQEKIYKEMTERGYEVRMMD